MINAVSSPPKRIAFVINSLGPGGAERVLDQLMRKAPPGAWDCHLVLLDDETEWRVPPDSVTVHRLDCKRGMVASLRQLKAALAVIRPGLVVSFLVRANVASVIASRMLGIPCIISERSQLSTHLANEHKGFRRMAATAAPRLTYPLADRVIAVSDGVRTDLVGRFGVKCERVQTIYNPYDLTRIRRDALAAPEFELPERFFVSAGRLVKRKGFDDLLDAYAAAKTGLPLCILGEGAERDRLAARIQATGLESRVRLLGYASNPFAILGRAEMFVSPSHCEGFPNAIAEAMVLGVPVVSTDCPSGPAELLDGVETVGFNGVHRGKYGMLVPVGRPELLARGIEQMNDPQTHSHYSNAARLRMDDFRIETIAAQFWDVFHNTIARDAVRAQKSTRPVPPERVASAAEADHA
jgi:glycosyltransferase involved in cell wall biosynthesis